MNPVGTDTVAAALFPKDANPWGNLLPSSSRADKPRSEPAVEAAKDVEPMKPVVPDM